MKKYKLVKQYDIRDCGAACLAMISGYYGLLLPINKFRDLVKIDNNGVNFYGIIEGAKKIGLEATGMVGSSDEFLDGIKNSEIKLPLIARVVIDKIIEHYIVIFEISTDKIVIGDPAKDKLISYSYDNFFEIWGGQILTFEKIESFKKGNEVTKSYSKYFRLVAINKKLLTKVIVLSIIISAIALLGSYIFQFIIDNVLGTTSNTKIYKLNIFCLCLGMLYILQTILEIVRGKILTNLCIKYDIPLLFNSFNHMIRLPINYFSTRRTGEILARLLDSVKIRDALSSSVLSIVLNLVIVITCGTILFIKSPILFGAVLVVVIIYVIINILFFKPIKKSNEELMEKNAIYSSYFKESIDGIETIKVFNCENYVANIAEKRVRDYIDSNVLCTLYKVNENALTSGVASIGILVMLWLGTNLVIKGTLTLGELMMCYSLIGYFINPVKNLIDLQPTLISAFVAATRLNDIVESKPEIINPKEYLEGISLYKDITLKNVNFRYGNRKLILNDINMFIKRGEKVAIVGKSGCGKTTLAKLLVRLYDVENGCILFEQYNIKDLPLESLRQKVSYISQNAYFFTDTIMNNLLLGNTKVSNEEFDKVMADSTITEFIDELPLGFDTVIEENAYNLSEGQKQRVAIARALLKKPDILIMDEITSNLDSITEKKVKQAISNISKNTTCIIIAHHLETIKDCDRIFVLDSGRLIENGTHESLMTKGGLYYQLWNDQLH